MKTTLCSLPVILLAATSVAVVAKPGGMADKPMTGGDAMYAAGCPDPCSFSVKSHDKGEVAGLLKQHASGHHGMSLGEKEAMAAVKMVKPMFVAGCPDPCSFSVHTGDKAEAASLLKSHAKMHHNKMVSDHEAAAMVRRDGEAMK